MITKDVLGAQLRLYQDGREKAISAHAKAEQGLEKVKTDLAALAGAIDACENLIRIATQLEQAQATPETTQENSDE